MEAPAAMKTSDKTPKTPRARSSRPRPTGARNGTPKTSARPAATRQSAPTARKLAAASPRPATAGSLRPLWVVAFALLGVDLALLLLLLLR
jgi:hypothetical protein